MTVEPGPTTGYVSWDREVDQRLQKMRRLCERENIVLEYGTSAVEAVDWLIANWEENPSD